MSHLCLAISCDHLEDLVHTLQTNKSPCGCSGTVDAPLVHCNNQLCLSWTRAYQVLPSMLNVFTTVLTLSLHLNLTPCAGHGLGNRPNSKWLGDVHHHPSWSHDPATVASYKWSSLPIVFACQTVSTPLHCYCVGHTAASCLFPEYSSSSDDESPPIS